MEAFFQVGWARVRFQDGESKGLQLATKTIIKNASEVESCLHNLLLSNFRAREIRNIILRKHLIRTRSNIVTILSWQNSILSESFKFKNASTLWAGHVLAPRVWFPRGAGNQLFHLTSIFARKGRKIGLSYRHWVVLSVKSLRMLR